MIGKYAKPCRVVYFCLCMMLAFTAYAGEGHDHAVGDVQESCANRCDNECPATSKIGCVAACPFGCPPHCCGCKSDKDGCDHSGCPTCSCSSPPCAEPPVKENLCTPEHQSCSERCYKYCKNGRFSDCLEHCALTGKYKCGSNVQAPMNCGDCDVCCKYSWDPAAYIECCTKHCKGASCIKP